MRRRACRAAGAAARGGGTGGRVGMRRRTGEAERARREDAGGRRKGAPAVGVGARGGGAGGDAAWVRRPGGLGVETGVARVTCSGSRRQAVVQAGPYWASGSSVISVNRAHEPKFDRLDRFLRTENRTGNRNFGSRLVRFGSRFSVKFAQGYRWACIAAAHFGI